MNGEAGLKCINKNYRKDGKGSVNLQPFPSFAEMFLKLNKNLQLTLQSRSRYHCTKYWGFGRYQKGG